MSFEQQIFVEEKHNLGGKSHSHPGSELEGNGKEADAYVRSKVPELAHAKLISYKTQVVAGSAYYFTYEGYPGEVKVFSQPWLHKLEVHLPNGTVFSNQA